MYAEGLGQSHAGSPVVGSDSVSLYKPKLVESVGFVVSLTPLASLILLVLLLQDFLSST